MTRKLYYNGKPTTTPEVTDLEAKLLKLLVPEAFGDSDNRGLISTTADDMCGEGGLERVNLIKWDGDRKQLGPLITSLQEKKLLIFDDPDDGYGTELWFDCDALSEVVRKHESEGR